MTEDDDNMTNDSTSTCYDDNGSPNLWSVNKVLKWINDIDEFDIKQKKQICEIMKDNQIDGATLLMLDSSVLQNDLGIKILKQRIILNRRIQNLKKSNPNENYKKAAELKLNHNQETLNEIQNYIGNDQNRELECKNLKLALELENHDLNEELENQNLIKKLTQLNEDIELAEYLSQEQNIEQLNLDNKNLQNKGLIKSQDEIQTLLEDNNIEERLKTIYNEDFNQENFNDINEVVLTNLNNLNLNSHYNDQNQNLDNYPNFQKIESSNQQEISNNIEFNNCLACTNRECFKLKCEHYYCKTCLQYLVITSLSDTNLLPVTCCEKIISINHIEKSCNPKLLENQKNKLQEKSIKNKMQCPNKQCSNLIDIDLQKQNNPDIKYISCKCKTLICLECKNYRHVGMTCEESKQNSLSNDDKLFYDFVKQEGQRNCQKCNIAVELTQGCQHMTCRCGFHFCQLCGAKWKTCNCITANENYVERELDRVVNNHLNDGIRLENEQIARIEHNIRNDVVCRHLNFKQIHKGNQYCNNFNCTFQCNVQHYQCSTCRDRFCFTCRQHRLKNY